MPQHYINKRCSLNLAENKSGISSFLPSAYYNKVRDIPFSDYRRLGYKYVFIDIDNTLMPHGSRHADITAVELVKVLKKQDVESVLYSNAGVRRLSQIAKELGIPAVYRANKPQADTLLRYCREQKIDLTSIIVVGDQLLTDVWAANQATVHSVLVDKIARKELWHIYVKRFLEVFIKRFYHLDTYFDLILLEKKTNMR